MNREIAEDILSEEGMCVESAEDGSVAVGIMEEKGPDYFDFILMDIQMPIMNGYEATKAIRAMYPEAKLPIHAAVAPKNRGGHAAAACLAGRYRKKHHRIYRTEKGHELEHLPFASYT